MKWTSTFIVFSAMASAVMAEPTTYTFSVTSGSIEFQSSTVGSSDLKTASSPVSGTFAVTVHHDLGMPFGDSTLFELVDANLSNTSMMRITQTIAGLCTATISPNGARFLDFNSDTSYIFPEPNGTVAAEDYLEATVVLSGILSTTFHTTAWSGQTTWNVKFPTVPVVPLTLQTSTAGGSVRAETLSTPSGATAQVTGTHHLELPGERIDTNLSGVTLHWDWVIAATGTVSHPLYPVGSSLRITATSEPGYQFVGWYVEEYYGFYPYRYVSTENPLAISMEYPTLVEASFTQAGCVLTLVADPNNGGTIEATPPPDSNGVYANGTVVTLTAQPAAGYSFVNWSGDASGGDNPTAITMNGSKAVTAQFAQQKYTLTLTRVPTSGGSIQAVPAPDGEGKYAHGTIVTLTANANAGYSFANWGGDATGSTNPVQITMDGNKTVTAGFEQQKYTLTLTRVPTSGGSIQAVPAPDGEGKYAHGAVVTLTANANAGYSFANWSGDASGSTNPVQVTIDGNKSVTASFPQMGERTTYTFSVTSGTMDFRVSDNQSPNEQLASSPVTGTFAVTVHHDLGMPFGDSTLFELVDANLSNTSMMRITQTIAGLCTATISPNGARFLDFNSDTSYIFPEPNGTVAAEDYLEATVVLSGILSTTFHTTAWSGQTTWNVKFPTVPVVPLTLGTSSPGGSVHVETLSTPSGAGAQLTGAHHLEFPGDRIDSGLSGVTLYWDWAVTAEGTVSPPLYLSGAALRITATPEPGYLFTGWSGDVTGPNNPATITMDGNKTVMAGFAPLTSLPVHNITKDLWYTTIQPAITAAAGGDVIVISPGTYVGSGNRDIDFLGKAITVRSTDPNDPNVISATVINCEGTESAPHRGFTFHSGEGSNAVVEGLTITGGYAPQESIWTQMRWTGGAIFCSGSSPTIRHCTLVGNVAQNHGAGIGCWNKSSPRIEHCTIRNNTLSSGWEGAGIACLGECSPTIEQCLIQGNSAGSEGGGGGIACVDRSHVTILNSTFAGNYAGFYGGALSFWNSNPTLKNSVLSGNHCDNFGGAIACWDGSRLAASGCTVVGNAASSFGGGIACRDGSDSTLTNCILWNNTSGSGPEIALVSGAQPTKLSVSYSDVKLGSAGAYVEPNGLLGWGQGNLSLDPLLADPNGGNCHLSAGSPCMNTGDPNGDYSGQTDLDGNPRVAFGRVDMGAYECLRATLTLTVQGSQYGAVTIEPNQPSYASNDVVTLTAHPGEMGTFMGWGGDAPNDHAMDNPLVLTMDGNKSVTASFTKSCHTLTVTITAHPEWGSVIVEPNLPCYEPNATVTLTAILTEPGKMWMGWSGDVDPNKRYTNPLTLIMNDNKVITTEFKCAMGVGQMLPLLVAGLTVLTLVRRRGRRRGE